MNKKSEQAIAKTINTIIIGNLATLEKHFGDIWGHSKEDGFTEEEEKNYEVYSKCRKEILDTSKNLERRLMAKLAKEEDDNTRHTSVINFIPEKRTPRKNNQHQDKD